MQKIEALRADLVAHPELLARFNEIHPKTLEEVLRSRDDTILRGCYDFGYKIRSTCRQASASLI